MLQTVNLGITFGGKDIINIYGDNSIIMYILYTNNERLINIKNHVGVFY